MLGQVLVQSGPLKQTVLQLIPHRVDVGPYKQMIRQRVRIRFRKEGDLRLISHRDLVRVFERMFRRADLQLSMSEGFHPKVRMSFPSALSLGIRGLEEVMEFELSQNMHAETLLAKLQTVAPLGLDVIELRMLEAGESKVRVERFTYEFPLPASRRERVKQSATQLMSQTSCLIDRPGRKEPVNVRTGLDTLELEEDLVRFRVLSSRLASARPREILEAIGLSDLEAEGHYLTRTKVEIGP